MRVPAATAKPLSGFAPTVSSRSPGLALMVSSAPVYVPTGTLTLPRISPSWSSCSRFTYGAGLGADHTVAALPPPCGTSAMLSSFTPIVAQSSEDASLIVSGMVPDIGVGVAVVEPEPPQPLTAAVRPIRSAPWSALLRILRCITQSLCWFETAACIGCGEHSERGRHRLTRKACNAGPSRRGDRSLTRLQQLQHVSLGACTSFAELKTRGESGGNARRQSAAGPALRLGAARGDESARRAPGAQEQIDGLAPAPVAPLDQHRRRSEREPGVCLTQHRLLGRRRLGTQERGSLGDVGSDERGARHQAHAQHFAPAGIQERHSRG